CEFLHEFAEVTVETLINGFGASHAVLIDSPMLEGLDAERGKNFIDVLVEIKDERGELGVVYGNDNEKIADRVRGEIRKIFPKTRQTILAARFLAVPLDP